MKVDSPLYIGKRHYDENGNHLGGIKVVVDNSKVVEVEGLEMKICREAYNSKDVLEFKNKTNKEVLDFIHGEFSCKFEQGKANSGDWILCRLVVLDNNKKDFSGTVKQILDIMQKEHSCRVSYGSKSMKQGGQIKDGKIISPNNKKFQKVEISEEELADRWHKKKEHITQMAENVQSLRYNVTKDIKSQDEKTKLTSLAIAVILNTAERVGNSDSEENGNLGVTGFQKKNIKIEGNTVYLEYVGKSSVEHEKQFSDELISLELRRAIKKSPCQFVFCTSDGFRIKADKINRYLQEFGVTAKDLRGFLANRYILDKLNKIDDAEILASESKRKKEFNKIIKSVALKVGHGAPTLKKHYMTPELESEFIENGVIISLKDFYKSGGELKKAEVKASSGGVGSDNLALKEIGVEIKKDNTSEGFYQVYKDGKFVGLLGSTSFVQARNKGQHFDEGLMSDILTRMGIEHSKAERNIQGENEFLTIRIKNSKAVEQSLIGQPTEVSVIEDKSVSDKIKIAENIIKGYRIKAKYAKGKEVDRVNGIIKAYEVRLKMLSKNKNKNLELSIPNQEINPNQLKKSKDDYIKDTDKQLDEGGVARFSIPKLDNIIKLGLPKNIGSVLFIRGRDSGNGIFIYDELGKQIKYIKDAKKEDFIDLYKSVGDVYFEQFSNGGEIKDKIVCSNCGWSWSLKDTEPKDAYICHKCGHDMSSKYCIAPNGKPSNLAPQQYRLVRTPQFIAWFGDWQNDKENSSKVIDENGEPLVLWHYAKRLQHELDKFYTFRVEKQLGSHFGTIKQAQNLKYIPSGESEVRTSNKELSDFRYYQVFLNIRNPIKLKDVGIFDEQVLLDSIGKDIKTYDWDYINNYTKKSKDSYLDRVKYIVTNNYGYDGVVYLNRYESDAESSIILAFDNDSDEFFRKKVPSAENSWIAFYPSQIKLADGTNTTFDSNSADVRYGNGGLIKINEFNKKAKLELKKWDYEHCETIEEKIKAVQGLYANEYYKLKNIIPTAEPDNERKEIYWQRVSFKNNNYIIGFHFWFDIFSKDKLKLSKVDIQLYDEDYNELDIIFEEGGVVSDSKETYEKWKTLVNMSKGELEKFYHSKEGEEAGLSDEEAKKLGIHSGRESAKWIMKMKDTPHGEWTPTMWEWAKRQIRFISRMSGNRGELYDSKGNKTRKHTSLLIWGHNPTKNMEKYKSGGEIASNQVVGGIIKAEDTNRYLILQRGIISGDYAKWHFVCGGVEEGESKEDAIKREVFEEIGYVINKGIKLKETKHFPNYDFTYFDIIVPKQFTPKINYENMNYVWVDSLEDALNYDLLSVVRDYIEGEFKMEKGGVVLQEYDLGGLIQSSVINKILQEVKPYQDEITQKWIESVKEQGDVVLREHDIEDFRFVLIMDLVKAIGNYIEPTDSVSDIKFTHSQTSILLNCKIIRDGNEFPFSTDIIFAGGYNIQKLHLRYIVNTKLPHKKTNTYFDKLNSEYKKITKIEKIKEQITYCEDHLERYKAKLEEARLNSLLSDDEIEKISREHDTARWNIVDTTWDEIVKRGADKNFNYDKNEYLKKLESIKEDYIYHWKLIYANPKQYENSVKREQKELDKLQKKLEELQADNIEDKFVNGSAIKLKLKSLLSILDSEKKYGKVENYKGIFNTKTTGISGLDELLKDDGYNYFYKGISGEVVMMSPSDYLKKVRTDITRTDTDLGIYAEKKERINEAIEKGNKINMPFLSIKENGKANQQEGRNRATIAKERGEKLIPVFIEKYLTFNDKIAKGNEYIKSAIKNGATTKEEVLSKLKEQGLHRDAIRFIDENFNPQLLEPSYKEKAEESSDSSLKDFYIEENYDCENYQKAIKFAKENGYYLKNDVSYNGFIFIEKLLEGEEEKIEIQVYDGITKDDVPNIEVLTKEAQFGSIMSETKYRFLPTQYHKKWDRDWYDLKDIDTAFDYAKKLEKNILEHNKNIKAEEPKISSDSVLVSVKPMSDKELQEIVGYEVYKRIIKAEEQLGEGVVDRNRMIETARRIQKADKEDKLLTQHIFEALHYEIGYPDNWQDLRNAIDKGGIDTNSEAIQRQIEVGVDLPKDIVEEFKKSKRYKTASPELVKAVEQSLKEHPQSEIESTLITLADADTFPKNHKRFVENLIKNTLEGINESKQGLEKLARSYGINEQNTAKELAELSIVMIARLISHKKNLSNKERYDALVNLYKNQVNLTHRTSNSIELQQYSTPCYIGYIMGLYCGVDKDGGNYFEPTAGNGQLTVAGRAEDFIVNEIDDIRHQNLEVQGFKEVLKKDASVPFLEFEKKFDAVITNPPFGTIEPIIYDKIEIKSLEQHMALLALRTMKDDGKAAIIVGGHTEWDSEGRIQAGKNRTFFVLLNRMYHVEDVINISGRDLYSRQGTAFNTRIILINGRKKEQGGLPPLLNNKLSVTENNSGKTVSLFDDLYTRVNNLL